MKRLVKLLRFIVCCAFLFSCITSCSIEPLDQRVSADELEQLRVQYPYNDSVPPMASVSYSHLQTWEQISSTLRVYAVVSLTLTDEWFSSDAPHSPIQGVKPQDVPAPLNSVTGIFHPAVVDKVLWGGPDLEDGEEITLFFSAIMPLDDLKETFKSDESYVCFLFDYRENNYNIPSFFVEKEDTWHLTDSNVLVAASSHFACIDECSGMYLDAFQSEIVTYLGPPDAELTPVEPELQTE
ncbi:MAG: hypothetical protein E7449_06060 [Ruminococcaceae bacterium]|nr:hypothetical protein [Oscillospiraceae bacterium]